METAQVVEHQAPTEEDLIRLKQQIMISQVATGTGCTPDQSLSLLTAANWDCEVSSFRICSGSACQALAVDERLTTWSCFFLLFASPDGHELVFPRGCPCSGRSWFPVVALCSSLS